MIAENLKAVRQRIVSSCEKIGRPFEDIKLICVTKEAKLGEIEAVLKSGVKDMGENRVQDALLKYRMVGDKPCWHLVGHLQTNKVKDAVKIFSLIHSVDSARLAKEIDKEAGKINKIQDILIQVNTSGEKTKFGIAPDEVLNLLKEISFYNNIRVKGFMTIAPEVENSEIVRPYFRLLRELRDKVSAIRLSTSLGIGNAQYAVRILSMGMSNDFEVAIEEGSNMIRIGRAIFKND